MKVLIIQLARLGDILQTWPTINGLKRINPDLEVDLLVRERFSSAALPEMGYSQLKVLPTPDILKPILLDDDCESSLEALNNFIEELLQEKYDKIINLSFSPFSSYLVHALETKQTDVYGYTRFADGYLSIPDDVSAYFYAQVGIGRPNRVHLTQIFSGVAGVELVAKDWQVSVGEDAIDVDVDFDFNHRRYIVVQMGASQKNKTYGESKWVQVFNHLCKMTEIPIVIVGSSEEQQYFEAIKVQSVHPTIVNCIGKTSIRQLFSVVKKASLVVCNDSLLNHVASLVDTPTLNISFSSVNFWETGPLAQNSRIIWGHTPEDIASDRVAIEINNILKNKTSGLPIVNRTSYGPVAYSSENITFENFNWELIEAIYMQQPFPKTTKLETMLAFKKLVETCKLAIEQIDLMPISENPKVQVEILNQVDQILEAVPRMAKETDPLIKWFQTERVRIGPVSLEQLLSQTKKLFGDLLTITEMYLNQFSRTENDYANTNVL